MKLKYSNFITKAMALLIILVIFACYENITVRKEKLVAENEAAVREAVEYNEKIEVETAASSEDGNEGGSYKDGTYDGTGSGFGGDIAVSVTVKGGKIETITVNDHASEDPAYYSQAEAVVDAMLAANSTEVDTVSGATFSSGGLIAAVEDALGKAVG